MGSLSCNQIQNENTYRNIVENIRSGILKWGSKNLRDFPWRNTRDPYKILIAEIMLHRTNADQVKPVYEKFIEDFPDFESIVRAGSEKIMMEMRSLGLYWRSDFLYRLAEEVMEKYNGILPLEKKKLMELPGVGHYIASAILCFGYNLPEPILDTNTVRVIGRIFGIKITDSSRRSKKFYKIMQDIVLYEEPRRLSLSMIDFAALVCTAKNPRHDLCPLRDICCFYKTEVA
ncbi:HhH-GPD family protein [Candidatus Methanoperedens nitratireducens]|uniref:T/G-specific DNA glycosylase n=1 Tax=Candidatus Methanoperedens nitratireducens TaxID=1392998 RepID=A0A284VM88_9EURY|nr:A/G-specific adenine glycosylase [Candidatus Methanoperedens nitroreducens]SNQ60396.1 T/G-specific DNA glycosylase [Candidatus Methanoperedens nitroreducens]